MLSIRQTWRSAAGLLTCVSLVALVAGCGGSGDPVGQTFVAETAGAMDPTPVQPASTARIQGNVFLDSPVSGASVQAWAPDGSVIASATTDSAGFFVFTGLQSLPRQFLVTATGGMYQGAEFSSTLMLVHDDASDHYGLLSVNLPTTLAAWVLQQAIVSHAQDGPEAAAARVRNYLALGPNYDLGIPQSTLFDPGAFLATYRADRLDAALPDLAAHIVEFPGDEQSFTSSGKIEHEIAGKAAVAGYKKMFQWMLTHENDAFAQTVGSWGMSVVSLVSGPDYSQEFAQINKSLDALKGQVQTLQNSLYDLDKSMQTQFRSVTAQLELLGNDAQIRALDQKFTTLDTAARAPIARIRGLQRTYQGYLTNPSEATPADLKALADDIRREVPAALLLLHDLQVGAGAAAESNSTIRVWHKLQAATTPGYPFALNADFFEALNQQQDYIGAWQVIGLNMLIDAEGYIKATNQSVTTMKALGPLMTSGITKFMLDQYGADLNEENDKVFAPRIDPGLVVDLSNGIQYVRTAAVFPAPAPGADTCSYLRMRWTELGITGERSLNDPSQSVQDCDSLTFPRARSAFNAMRPFGFSDWAIGPLPAFLPRRGTNAYVQLTGFGFDFSSSTRLTSLAALTGGGNGLAFGYTDPSLVAFIQFLSDNNPLSVSDSSSFVPATEMWKRAKYPSAFFSRPFAPTDPLAAGCAPVAGRIVCAKLFQ